MGKDLAKVKHTFFFCDGGSCQKAGSENVVREARALLRNKGLWDESHTIKTRCNGRCEDAPTCIVQNGNFWYKNLTPLKIKEVVNSHLNNNTPLEPYLLYKNKGTGVMSENERPVIKPKDFVLKTDDELGEVYITKGFNSDQYLYPLFLSLIENKVKAVFKLADAESYCITDLQSVVYESDYHVELIFKELQEIKRFTIGSVPKHEDDSLINSKISSTEYYISKDSLKKGIRFKNKKGKFVGLLQLDAQEVNFWNYCLKIQLQGLNNPVENMLNV